MLSKKWRWIGVFFAAWSLETFAENHPTMEISPTEEVEVAPDSPRASFRSYMDAVRRGNYRQASIFLDLREVSREDGPRLARNLKAVIDRKLNIDLEKLSPEATGFLQDSLPSHLEEVARIELDGNASAPIVMKRVRDENGARWVFTSNTVKNIERWYAELADKWALEHLPEPLLRSGPKDIRWWQWLGLLLLSVGAWALGWLLAWGTRTVFQRIAARTEATWDDGLFPRLNGPATLAWAVLVAWLSLPWLALYPASEAWIRGFLKALTLLTLTWAGLRYVDVLAQELLKREDAVRNQAAKSLVPLAVRIVKAGFVVMGLIALLSGLGLPVASLLAGLGIGGLAIALAGQKTIENLFGAFSLGLDQPFREGDTVKVEGTLGTIEAIGLRSTRIRTQDRTLVSIPNGKLSEMKLESFTARDRFRLACEVPITFQSPPSCIRQALKSTKAALVSHPQYFADSAIAHIKEVGASAMVLEFSALYLASDFESFASLRDEVLLMILTEIKKAGCTLAYPTSSIQLIRDFEKYDKH